ncbi:NAD(P)-dependent oxidoreductase [Elioraea tepidiphila]|jgi:3-hydroxyisobutyrate dehydrogenase|uniref:NAD(P)-dependent oxidoreductase n=1 Tax=Elioraea tepidiphila TaxID=457934 RepID=UPI00037BB3BF|nr:NAD(P)-dependent oxidoreductase [Elioraea tepidiphila]
MQVAVIGLGAMGLAMAERLAERGEAVQGWDRDPARRKAAEAAGLAVAEDAATGAEVVILSLPNDDAVRAVAATLPAAGMMADGVVVDTSTVAPETPRALAPGFSATGLAWLDAPVSGGPHGARAGKLTMMVGGEAEALARAMPALEAIAAKVVHVGASGAGAVAKLANNLLVAAHLLTAAEALRLARRAGVEAEAALAVINGASGRSAATEVNFPRWILPGSFDSGFTAGLMRKDVRLALELAERVGGTGTLMEEVGRLWMRASAVPDGADFNRVAAELWQAEAGDA